MSTHLERMLKAAGQNVPASKPILEINPGHPIVQRLKDEADERRFTDWSHILFDQALLAEGGQLDDPAGFVKRLNEVMLTLAGGAPSQDLDAGVVAPATPNPARCAPWPSGPRGGTASPGTQPRHRDSARTSRRRSRRYTAPSGGDIDTRAARRARVRSCRASARRSPGCRGYRHGSPLFRSPPRRWWRSEPCSRAGAGPDGRLREHPSRHRRAGSFPPWDAPCPGSPPHATRHSRPSPAARRW